MSDINKRLNAFKQLPLRAQLAMITSTLANPVLAKNQIYINQLKQIHAECLANATPEAKQAYERAIEDLS